MANLPPAVTPHEGFLQRVGEFFESLFSAASSLFNKLSDNEKAAAVWGSGVITCINNDLDAAPPDVIALIKSKFPDLDMDTLHGFLEELLQKINNIQGAVPLTLEDAIAALQKYLKQYDGSTWSIVSSAAASIISTLYSPGTDAEKFVNIGTYTYQAIVRPHVKGA